MLIIIRSFPFDKKRNILVLIVHTESKHQIEYISYVSSCYLLK